MNGNTPEVSRWFLWFCVDAAVCYFAHVRRVLHWNCCIRSLCLWAVWCGVTAFCNSVSLNRMGVATSRMKFECFELHGRWTLQRVTVWQKVTNFPVVTLPLTPVRGARCNRGLWVSFAGGCWRCAMAFCNSAFADRGGVAAKTVFGTAGRHKPSGSGGIKIALVFSVFFVPGIFFP